MYEICTHMVRNVRNTKTKLEFLEE